MREVSASEKGIWWAAEWTQELGRPLPGSDSESLRMPRTWCCVLSRCGRVRHHEHIKDAGHNAPSPLGSLLVPPSLSFALAFLPSFLWVSLGFRLSGLCSLNWKLCFNYLPSSGLVLFFCYQLHLAPATNVWVSSPSSAQGWVYWLSNREHWMRNVLLSSNSSNSNFSFKSRLFMYLSIHLIKLSLASFLSLSFFPSFFLPFIHSGIFQTFINNELICSKHWAWGGELKNRTKLCVELIFQQRRHDFKPVDNSLWHSCA